MACGLRLPREGLIGEHSSIGQTLSFNRDTINQTAYGHLRLTGDSVSVHAMPKARPAGIRWNCGPQRCGVERLVHPRKKNLRLTYYLAFISRAVGPLGAAIRIYGCVLDFVQSI